MRIVTFILFIFIQFTCWSQEHFIKAKGQNLILSGKGETILLKGICFGNQVWSDVRIPELHHNEEDFQRVKAMGMNCIRFYMNYLTFEEDDTPFEYKKEGWDWLDKNIAWAKKHGIYLILNMHVPQGGFQSNAKGHALWQEKMNQVRLKKLWRAIANRYANEPIIAGYDLLNEPGVPDSAGQWKQLAQDITDDIRTVDKNHLIIVERTNSINKKWTNDEHQNMFLIDDPNVLYEFHFYSPIEYTHQNTPWTGLGDGGEYPNNNILSFPDGLKWYSADFEYTRFETGSQPWKFYEGHRFTITDDYIKVAKPVLLCKNNHGAAYFADFLVKEYDEKGHFVRDVITTNSMEVNNWYFWAADGNGSMKKVEDFSMDEKDVIKISGTTGDANASSNDLRFIPVLNHSYQINGWVKTDRMNRDAECGYRLDFETYYGEFKVYPRNKGYLEAELLKYIEWGKTNNVPLYLGEFGLYEDCFKRNKGGLEWVEDMLDLLQKYALNFTYHTYHEDAFGLYKGHASLPSEKKANKKLIQLFSDKLNP